MHIPEVEDLRRAIAEGRSVPVVLVLGGDDAVYEGVANVLCDDLKKQFISVTRMRLDAEPSRSNVWSALTEVASTIPMFNEGTLVIIAGVDCVIVPEALRQFLSAPPSHVRLLLISDKKTGPLVKLIEKAGRVISPAELRDREAVALVQTLARNNGLLFDLRTASALIDMVGTDRAQIEATLTTLMAYKGKGARVVEEDLRGLVHRTRENKRWDLEDAIYERDLKRALKVASRELEDSPKGAVVNLLHDILRIARQLLLASEMIESGTSDEAAMSALKLKDYPWKKLKEATSRFSKKRLIAFLREGPVLEILVKRSEQNASPEAVITDILFRLIGK